MQQAKIVVAVLSDVQFDFIEDELGFNKAAIQSMDDDSISDMYDNICDIEVEETISAGDNELSERGKIAAGIVTLIGNEIYSDMEDETVE